MSKTSRNKEEKRKFATLASICEATAHQWRSIEFGTAIQELESFLNA